VNLYIDTSGPHCEIALFSELKCVDEVIHTEAQAHSVVIHDLTTDLLTRNKLGIKQLSAVAVLNGPGSYTGLRVGLAAAKGYCYALNIPLLLFNKVSLHLDYYQHLYPLVTGLAFLEVARQGEFFFSMRIQKQIILPPSVYTVETIAQELAQYPDCMLISTHDDLTFNDRKINHIKVSKDFIAQKLHEKLLRNDVADVFRAEPFYLKKVHANVAKKRF